MTDGQVFCLDTQNETFIQQQGGSYAVATVKKFPIIDVDEGLCLSVGESGDGSLHKIELTK